jgi:hypothetical protein
MKELRFPVLQPLEVTSFGLVRWGGPVEGVQQKAAQALDSEREEAAAVWVPRLVSPSEAAMLWWWRAQRSVGLAVSPGHEV